MTVTPASRCGLYDVTSERDAETVYVVDLNAGSCTCPHHQYRQARCKHLIAAEAHAAQETKLARAERVAANLPDADLIRFAREKSGTPAGAACWLTLAGRAAERQAAAPEAPRPPVGTVTKLPETERDARLKAMWS